MNNTDVWVRQGAYGTEEDAAAVSTWRRQGNTLTFPRIQGTDTVGNIVAVGEGVSPARIGERVMVDFSIYNRDDDSARRHRLYGPWPRRRLCRVP